MPSFTARIVRFGTFEADLTSGELRKNGAKIRLQEQPFEVMVALLERAGEMVSREELQQRLWPSDTFVDFDHSLNTAVNKLRDALGDSASNPRFVETVARRGYRFIAPIEIVEGSSPNPEQSLGPERAAPHVVSAETAAPAFRHPELDVPLPERGLTRGLFALIQIMYLIFYGVALARFGEVRRVADSFLPGWGATAIISAVLVTAGIGIPLRLFLLSSVGFDHRGLGEKFRRLFPAILALDQLWAMAPFLCVEGIGFGAAFAVCAALLYLPFGERSLIRMAYAPNPPATTAGPR